MSWSLMLNTLTFTGSSDEFLEETQVSAVLADAMVTTALLNNSGILYVEIVGYGGIGAWAFRNAASLARITISDTVTAIGLSAFAGATSLTSVIFGSGSQLVTIGDRAFAGATALTTITIPAGVTAISTAAFQGARALQSITIPAGVTSIGSSAFNNAISLTAITIPAGVTSIGHSAFRCAPASPGDGIVSSLASVTFAAGSTLTTIGQSAFSWTKALQSITIPDSVNLIEGGAFDQSALATVYINYPNGLNQSYGAGVSFYGAIVNIQPPPTPPPPTTSPPSPSPSLLLYLPTLAASVNSTITASFVENYTFAMGPYDAQLYTSITVADMQSVFKFSSDSVPNSDYLDNDDEAHVYACAKLFKAGSEYKLSTSIAPADANPSNSSNLLDHATATGKPHGVAVETFLQKVAARVIGSKLALDMLLNETAIAGGYIAAINKCITSVNNNFPSGAAASVATANASYAAERIYKAMTYAQSSRFGLKYKAIVPGTVPPSQGPHACTASPSTTAAAVSVEIAANGSVSNMTLTTPGTGFILGQSVAFRSGDVVVASIASINSVQVAMLNGTLDAQTPMPFEGGDMFTVMFTVSTADGQLNVSGDHVSTSTVTQVNIKVV